MGLARCRTRTNRFAAARQRQGVRHDDRVAVLTLNSVAVMEVNFALAKLGSISVPINFRLTLAEVNYLMADSGTSFVFRPTLFAPAIGGGHRKPRTRRAGRHIQRHLRDHVQLRHDRPAEGRHPHPGQFHPECGQPAKLWPWRGREDQMLSATPLFHIGALGVLTMPYADSGEPIFVMEAFNPEGWPDLAEKYRITMAVNVPAMRAGIAQAPTPADRYLSSLPLRHPVAHRRHPW